MQQTFLFSSNHPSCHRADKIVVLHPAHADIILWCYGVNVNAFAFFIPIDWHVLISFTDGEGAKKRRSSTRRQVTIFSFSCTWTAWTSSGGCYFLFHTFVMHFVFIAVSNPRQEVIKDIQRSLAHTQSVISKNIYSCRKLLKSFHLLPNCTREYVSLSTEPHNYQQTQTQHVDCIMRKCFL